MFFHTWTFLIFFVITFLGLMLLRKSRFWLHWLLAASYLFYGWWNPFFLLLIVYSTALDYFAVLLMDRTKYRKTWMVLSLSNNLLLLGFFKYIQFIAENFNLLFDQVGIPIQIREFREIMLPAGISFYTFQSMCYVIDFYRGTIPREKSFIRFATFVAFFPQLVAGPIERCGDLLPQLYRVRLASLQDWADGCSLFLVGLFKKLALANYLALYVDKIFNDPGRYDAPAILLAGALFGWQIYFDFSGYSDMARGVAKVIGVDLMINFRHPYWAKNLSEFWQRWHISLSQWFRDYLYFPLGGNRGSWLFTYRNLMIVFIVSGLWHGASWAFILWGFWHGIGICVSRSIERSRTWLILPKIVQASLVYLFVTIGWLFFRAKTFSDLQDIFSQLLKFAWQDPQVPLWMLAMVTIIWLYQGLLESRLQRFVTHPIVQVSLAIGMLIYLFAIPTASNSPFIYFQF